MAASNPLDFTDVNRSHVIRQSGKSLRYPTRKDYYTFLKATGTVTSTRDFENQHHIVIQVHRDWHHRGAQGCHFARLMIHNPEAYGWDLLVIGGKRFTGLSSSDIETVAEPVQRAIEDPNNAVLSLIFPEVTKSYELAALIRFLSRLPGWTGIEVGQSDDLVNIGLRVLIERRESVLAWPLGFGPYEFLPATRYAPFTEIVFASKPKVHPMPEQITPGDCAAHLADTWHVLGMEKNVLSQMWENTVRYKESVLAGSGGLEDKRAKAQVTVSVPRTAWLRSNAVL